MDIQSLRKAVTIEEEDNNVCIGPNSFATPYNLDPKVPPYTGIMFDVFALQDIDIKTFEIDIRNDLIGDDHSIEVYARKGQFNLVINDPFSWQLIARTSLSHLVESNSYIIPAGDFKDVNVKAQERYSFYITMKGDFIDHKVNALLKTGEMATSNDDMQLFAGVGFHDIVPFRSDIDTIVDPQFAGVIHYDKVVSCDLMVEKKESTVINYFFLVEDMDTDYNTILINDAVDIAITDAISDNQVLNQYANDFELTKAQMARTNVQDYTSACPLSWTVCPSSYFQTDIELTYHNELHTGLVEYEMYRIVDEIARSVQSKFTPEKEVLYIGQKSTTVPFALKMVGAPYGVAMNPGQVQYFTDVAEDFLQLALKGSSILSFKVQVEEQDGLKLRRNLEGEFNLIRGTVFGAAPSQQGESFFGEVLQKTLIEYKDILLANMKVEGTKPGVIKQDQFEYFLSLTDLEASVETKTDPTAAPTPEKTIVGKTKQDNTTIFNILKGVGGFVVLVGLLFYIRHKLKERKDAKERTMYREKMRDERREKRLQRSESKIDFNAISECDRTLSAGCQGSDIESAQEDIQNSQCVEDNTTNEESNDEDDINKMTATTQSEVPSLQSILAFREDQQKSYLTDGEDQCIRRENKEMKISRNRPVRKLSRTMSVDRFKIDQDRADNESGEMLFSSQRRLTMKQPVSCMRSTSQSGRLDEDSNHRKPHPNTLQRAESYNCLGASSQHRLPKPGTISRSVSAGQQGSLRVFLNKQPNEEISHLGGAHTVQGPELMSSYNGPPRRSISRSISADQSGSVHGTGMVSLQNGPPRRPIRSSSSRSVCNDQSATLGSSFHKQPKAEIGRSCGVRTVQGPDLVASQHGVPKPKLVSRSISDDQSRCLGIYFQRQARAKNYGCGGAQTVNGPAMVSSVSSQHGPPRRLVSRSVSDNQSGSLGIYFQKQPSEKINRLCGSQTVNGPAMVSSQHGPPRKPVSRSVSADQSGRLGTFLQKQPNTQMDRLGGAQTVNGPVLVSSQHGPPRRPIRSVSDDQSVVSSQHGPPRKPVSRSLSADRSLETFLQKQPLAKTNSFGGAHTVHGLGTDCKSTCQKLVTVQSIRSKNIDDNTKSTISSSEHNDQASPAGLPKGHLKRRTSINMKNADQSECIITAATERWQNETSKRDSRDVTSNNSLRSKSTHDLAPRKPPSRNETVSTSSLSTSRHDITPSKPLPPRRTTTTGSLRSISMHSDSLIKKTSIRKQSSSASVMSQPASDSPPRKPKLKYMHDNAPRKPPSSSQTSDDFLPSEPSQASSQRLSNDVAPRKPPPRNQTTSSASLKSISMDSLQDMLSRDLNKSRSSRSKQDSAKKQSTHTSKGRLQQKDKCKSRNTPPKKPKRMYTDDDSDSRLQKCDNSRSTTFLKGQESMATEATADSSSCETTYSPGKNIDSFSVCDSSSEHSFACDNDDSQ